MRFLISVQKLHIGYDFLDLPIPFPARSLEMHQIPLPNQPFIPREYSPRTSSFGSVSGGVSETRWGGWVWNDKSGEHWICGEENRRFSWKRTCFQVDWYRKLDKLKGDFIGRKIKIKRMKVGNEWHWVANSILKWGIQFVFLNELIVSGYKNNKNKFDNICLNIFGKVVNTHTVSIFFNLQDFSDFCC